MSVAELRRRLETTPPGYRYSHGRILAIYSGLMATLLLASLDQTIVSTALPRIVSDLGGLGSYSWVFTAYMLASTVTVPVYGKLGDIHGRRPLIMVAVTMFLVGSALCGIAQNMPELVLFRGIQGLGAGGLFPLSMATVANIVPPRDRGRYQGLIGAVFAASSIAGPIAGGFIVDHASWRWVFFVNLPVGAVALALIAVVMPRRGQRLPARVDWLGASVLAAGTTALLMGLVWGGQAYPWASVEVIGALAAAAVLLVVFGLVERRVAEPILPFDLLRAENVAASVACVSLVGMAMFGAISYVPLFVQDVIGVSAASSGVVLTPLMLGAVGTSIISGRLISRYGRLRPFVLFGPVVMCVGLLLFSRMGVHATSHEAALSMVLAGVGLGSMMQVFVLSAQNSASREKMGAVTALTQFGRSVGATAGVALMGVIVNQGLPRLPSSSQTGSAIDHRNLPLALRAELAAALRPAFLVAALVCLVILAIAAVGIREIPLRRGFDVDG